MLNELIESARNPLQTTLLLFLVSGIVFESKIPTEWCEWADTIYGKTIIIAVFLFLEYNYNWTLGILWLLFALLLVSPQAVRMEGFNDYTYVNDKKKKWFVEEVLSENPVAIKEREINTYPVQN